MRDVRCPYGAAGDGGDLLRIPPLPRRLALEDRTRFHMPEKAGARNGKIGRGGQAEAGSRWLATV